VYLIPYQFDCAPSFQLEAVYKRRPQSGGRRFVQFGHFADKGEGGLQMHSPQFLAQKTSDFLKFMVCPHGQGGRRVEPVKTFCGQGEKGVGHLLWTAPYNGDGTYLLSKRQHYCDPKKS